MKKCLNCQSFVTKKLFPEYCDAKNYICKNCGLVQILDRDSIGTDYYKNDGYFGKFRIMSHLIGKSFLIDGAQKRVTSMLEMFPEINFQNKKILEIGCAKGELIYILKEKFHSKVVGVESSRQDSRYGKKVFGIQINNCDFEAFESPQKFDLIICNHTLEHVLDPKKFLVKIKKMMKNDGVAYIEVPNIMWPSFGVNLDSFLYPEHLQTFSVSNLTSLLVKSGLGVKFINDDTFLRFVVAKDVKNTIKPRKINHATIIKYLRKYKKTHGEINIIKSKISFILGVTRALYFKVIDIAR